MKKILSGKVRDVYEINEKELVIVTTDRISAFDVILKSTIKNKGVALNLTSAYWFDYTSKIIPNHMISTNLSDMPDFFSKNPARFDKRTVLVKKLNMLPYEFIVRGYMFGSMWEEYKTSGTFCGQKVEGGYTLAQKLVEPVITPSVKNDTGHDEYISLERLRAELGAEKTDTICNICLMLYNICYKQALKNGIIIADTKFEFGYDEKGALTLGDEIFTPDSSRFWALSDYQAGETPKSYDKQFVRDWLVEHKLKGVTPAPELPEEIVNATAGIYKECYRRITGRGEY
ncbi:MAG: phosphoribosylaminoimidazolesuccinocarboxamide synthase [Lachnospiraceae bacterium]|nr:phosphoribosylaminoimidazolesuccinocarboxamide synthase [Lachnospiraceae bacterium]